MDEFVASLESTGSMDLHKDLKMMFFRNLFPKPLTLESDLRVALTETIFPSKIKNLTRKNSLYTQQKLLTITH